MQRWDDGCERKPSRERVRNMSQGKGKEMCLSYSGTGRDCLSIDYGCLCKASIPERTSTHLRRQIRSSKGSRSRTPGIMPRIFGHFDCLEQTYSTAFFGRARNLPRHWITTPGQPKGATLQPPHKHNNIEASDEDFFGSIADDHLTAW
jgi:hypothetical protein